jgi:hypothetical protein
MRRRRLIIAAVLIATAALAAWMIGDPLSADERRLAGAWKCEDADPFTMEFAADRRFSLTTSGDLVQSGTWRFRDGAVYVDCEANLMRRMSRTLLDYLDMPVGEAYSFRIKLVNENRFENADQPPAAGPVGAWNRVR